MKRSKIVTINYDAPAEVHKAIRGIKDDSYIIDGDKKRIPDIYHELILYSSQHIKPGDDIDIPEYSGRRIKTIFYISSDLRGAIDKMFNSEEEFISIQFKIDIMLKYALKHLHNINI